MDRVIPARQYLTLTRVVFGLAAVVVQAQLLAKPLERVPRGGRCPSIRDGGSGRYNLPHIHWRALPRAGSGRPGAAALTCRPSRLRAVHDVGDRSDEEPYPAHALALRLAGSGVTRDSSKAGGPHT